jgi:arylsulfatase
VLPKEDYQQYLGKPRIQEETAKFLGMVENIDANFGTLLKKIKEWGIEENTLVIYFGSDNGGTGGVKIFNAGMKGHKATPYQGGTRVPVFFRWPAGGIPAGAECGALTAHLDLFQTLAEITGATLSDKVKRQVEGRSLVPLLKEPTALWPDRTLVHHVGRWTKGQAEGAKYSNCSIQNSRFTLVNNTELYDLKADPGEETNVIAAHPEVVAQLRAAYDQWWRDVQPLLVNEGAVDTKQRPFRELYIKQFGKIPDAAPATEAKPDGAPDEDARAKRLKLREERKKQAEGVP